MFLVLLPFKIGKLTLKLYLAFKYTLYFMMNIFNNKFKKEYAKSVAYFSMEFGIDQALKTYSGGLGYLAGSHMRSAFALNQNRW